MNFETRLKSISDSDLLSTTKRLASEERRIGIEVLHHLREIDARKLFASLGLSSLFAYCIAELGYSEGGAHRRISAMRLLRDVPEYEVKLERGEVTVATLSQIQSFLVQEKRQFGKNYSTEEKTELLAKVEGKSSHQTERVLATLSPQSAREEKARPINEEETEIRFTASRELMTKMERLKQLLGHKPKTQTYAGLIEELVNLGIKKLDPLEKADKNQRKEKVATDEKNTAKELSLTKAATEEPSLPPVEVKNKIDDQKTEEDFQNVKVLSRYIPAATKRAVWHRDGGQCAFVDSKTGCRCESRHSLEYEHIQPFALGGGSSLENLKLLCPAHNRYAAIQVFGLQKMQRFWAK
jgi:hypothetical protein